MMTQSFVVRLCNHMLPMCKIATEMVHHLKRAECCEFVQILFDAISIRLALMVNAVRGCNKLLYRWYGLFTCHFDLTLRDVVLHCACRPSNVMPRQLLQSPVLCLACFSTCDAVATIVSVASTVDLR